MMASQDHRWFKFDHEAEVRLLEDSKGTQAWFGRFEHFRHATSNQGTYEHPVEQWGSCMFCVSDAYRRGLLIHNIRALMRLKKPTPLERQFRRRLVRAHARKLRELGPGPVVLPPTVDPVGPGITWWGLPQGEAL